MIRGSAAQERAIRSGDAIRVWCDAHVGGRLIARDVPVTGSVSLDSGSFVRRTASLSFRRTEKTEEALTRRNVEVRIRRGATRLGWSSAIPVFCGVLAKPRLGIAEITTTGADLFSLVSQDRFLRPRASTRGYTIPAQIVALLNETLRGIEVVNESGVFAAVPAATWEQNRNDAVSELAASIGCEVFLRPDRKIALRRVRSLWSPADMLWRSGVNLASHEVDVDWESVRNAIVVSSDRTDAGEAIIGIAEDTNPDSPTWVGHGRNTGYVTNGLVTTPRQAQDAASAVLARRQGAKLELSFDGALHPGVEAGDRHNIFDSGRLRALILDSASFDLWGAALSGTGREATVPMSEREEVA